MTRKMKDSGIEWIGEIPEDWGVNKLKHICDFKNGLAHEKNVELKGTYTVVNSKFVSTEGKVRVYSNELIVPLHKNDVCIVMSDVPNGKAYAKCYIIEKGNAYTLNQRIGCFYNIKIDLKYFYYYLNRNQGLLIFDDGINQTNLRKPDLINLMFLIPPLVEQKQIANYLDTKCSKIDETIQKEKQVIEKLKQYKQSVITEAVTKGLDPDVKMKDSGVEWIGEIPEHWSISRFSFETWVRARLGWKGLKADEYVQDGYIFLATPNIKNKDIDFVNVNYIDEFRYEESPEIKLSIGDVLLTKDGSTLGTVNVVRYLPKGATVNSSIAVITPGSNLDGIFLMYQIKGDYIKKIIENKKDGMGVPHLFQKDINKIYITLPPIEEQKQIATYLDKKCASIDKAISNKEKLIEKLTEYKKSLIYECVTGKREV